LLRLARLFGGGTSLARGHALTALRLLATATRCIAGFADLQLFRRERIHHDGDVCATAQTRVGATTSTGTETLDGW
jgi:hypothetical protein